MLVKFSHKQTIGHIDFTHHQDQQLYFTPHVMTFCAVHKKDMYFDQLDDPKEAKKQDMVFSRRGCCCTAVVVVGMKHFRYVGPRPGMLPP